MKLISRDTDYAVRALCYIGGNKGRLVSVPELVSELKTPRPFLRKILQRLSHEGILRSTRGKGGGFTALRPVKDIYLSELMRIFQGPLSLNECLFKKVPCPNKKICVLRKKIQGIEQHVARLLSSITIASITKGPGATNKPACRQAGSA